MGGTAARGGAATLLANAAGQAIRLGATLVMARLLAPGEFGLFAMINSTIGIAGVLRDMGLSSATIQSPSLTERQLSTLFWINAGFGLFATLVIAVASPWVAEGLRAPGSTLLIVALAPTFMLGGLATQHRALLSRKLAFVSLARMTLWSVLASQCLALLLAACGAGIWALVFGALATECIVTVWCWRAESWRPIAVFSLTEARPMLVFGGYLSAFSILGYLAGNLHQLLIGIFSGTAAAGYFNRAYVLLLAPIAMILMPVGGVVTATLSRVQSDPPAFAHYYLRSMATVNLLSAPLGCYSLLFAPELVRLLLGPGWVESGVLLRLMAVSLIVQPLMFSTGWVYMALGEARRAFWWGNVGWSLILAMYLPGLYWGARGVATAHSLALLLLVWPCLHFAFRGTRITTRNTLHVCAPAAIAAAIAVLPAWGLRELLPNLPLLIALSAGSLVYAGSYIGLLFAVGEKSRLINLWGHLRSWMHA
ncbi:MAG: lipopolysaccharide biosynthesis protein [Stenotrophobium sp.]